VDREVEQVTVEDLPVEEEDRAERLILGGRGHLSMGGQMSDKRLQLRRPNLFRMALVIK
jgi:hypothetical protein